MPFDIWLPVNDYMRSKGLAEKIADSFVLDGAPIVIVNPTWIVGPGEVFMTPVAQVVRDVINGQMPAINPAGINLVDVDDVADGHVLAETRGCIGERYILGGENVDYPAFLDAIADAAGGPRLATDTVPPSACPKEFLFYDSSKARRELGWSSRPLKDTIARSVAYMRTKGY